MNHEEVKRLTKILYKMNWKAHKEELRRRVEKSTMDLFNHINIQTNVKQVVNEILDWPPPTIKLVAILVDYITPEDANLTVSATPEGVVIRFNEDLVLRLEKTMINS